LLFGARFPAERAWPHSHRATAHLLLDITLLKSPSRFSFSESVPPVSLAEPLPTMFGVRLRPLEAHHFHGAAVPDVEHSSLLPNFFFEPADRLTILDCHSKRRKRKDRSIDVLAADIVVRTANSGRPQAWPVIAPSGFEWNRLYANIAAWASHDAMA